MVIFISNQRQIEQKINANKPV